MTENELLSLAEQVIKQIDTSENEQLEESDYCVKFVIFLKENDLIEWK